MTSIIIVIIIMTSCLQPMLQYQICFEANLVYNNRAIAIASQPTEYGVLIN